MNMLGMSNTVEYQPTTMRVLKSYDSYHYDSNLPEFGHDHNITTT